MLVQNGIYQHYKGNTYEVIGMAKHSETHEDMVVYRALHKSDLSELWVRPLQIFLEEVEVNGQKIPRFKKI